MRITGGTARGRKLISPKARGGEFIRPTSDRVREALFSILGKMVIGTRVLDLFAGTGSLGLEALSRGAQQAVFIDQSPQALDLIHRNIALCFPDASAEYHRLDLNKKSTLRILESKLAGNTLFNLVFLDPPYEKNLAEMTLTMIEKSGLLAPDALVVAEERAKISLPEQTGCLQLHQHRRYGETGIWLYKLRPEAT